MGHILKGKEKLISKLTLGVMAFAALSSAHATTVITVKNWTLDEYSTSAQPNAVCVASTWVRKSGTVYRLEIVKSKNTDSATEVLFRQTGAGENTAAWHVRIADSGKNLNFGPLSVDAASQTKFWWALPRTEVLLQQLQAGNDLRAYSHGGSKEVKFDLKADGAAQVLATMQSRCNGNQPLNNAEFERVFMAKSQRDVAPLNLNMATINSLRSLFSQARGIWSQKLSNEAEMERLRAQYAAELREYEPLKAEADQIANVTLPRLRQEQQANEARKVASEAELRNVIASIPRLQTDLSQAQTRLSRAQQAIAPHQAEHGSLSDQVRLAAQGLAASESRLDQILREISINERELRELDNELIRNDREAQDARYRLNSAERELSDANLDYRRFNPTFEERERLRNNSNYQRANSELPSAQAEHSRLQGEQARLTAERDRAVRDLQTCQATEGADCSSQQAEAQRATNAANAHRDQVRQALARVEQLQNTIRSAERDAAQEVRRIQERLADRVRDAEAEVNRLERIIVRAEQRSRDIRMIEIPNRQSRLKSLRREQSIAESDIASYEANLRNRERDLANFESRVGWVAKASELEAAENNLYSRSQALRSAESRKIELEGIIALTLRERTRIADAITERTGRLQVAQARLAQLSQALQPFETERRRIDGAGQAILAQLTAVQTTFDQTLPAQ